MRQQVIDKIRTKALGGISISNELPYGEKDVPLYLKNPKTIYVDLTQYESEPLFLTFGGCDISNTTTVVELYFTTDAKKLPANYDTVVDTLRAVKDEIEFNGAVNREAFVSTSYDGDLLITVLEYRLTRII